VIGDSRYQGPGQQAEAEVYTPFRQDAWFEFVALRTAVPEEGVMGAVRKIIRQMDPALPIAQVRTMRQSIDLANAMPRAMMALVLGFSAITLAMATLGLGGVMAYSVSRRRREIGLRMALGACGSDVSREVIRHAARLIAAGCAIGVAGAFVSARVLESFLYGVRPHDPAALAAAPLVLAAIALLACLAPAHRAASVEPMAALRQE
jgi:ABC-type antimicrobial peptide transport system permease subunit